MTSIVDQTPDPKIRIRIRIRTTRTRNSRTLGLENLDDQQYGSTKQKKADTRISDTEPNINIVALTRKGESLTWQVVMVSYDVTSMLQRQGELHKETAITMWCRRWHDDGDGIWVQDPERRKDFTVRMYGTHCIRLHRYILSGIHHFTVWTWPS